MRLYSNTLKPEDVQRAFREARTLDHQDIYPDDVRYFRPRGGRYAHGVQFYAYSLRGSRPTGHRAIGSYSLDEVDRAASWDAYGYVMARLFQADPDATIGWYDGREDFIRKVEASNRREPRDFLELVRS